jgi:hypothetical protein
MSSDPRCQVWAYVTDGKRLFEVTEHASAYAVTLEDCSTGQTVSLTERGVIANYELVRAAPSGQLEPGLA